MSQLRNNSKHGLVKIAAISAVLALSLGGCGTTSTSGVSMISKGYVSGVAHQAPAALRWLGDFLMPSAMATISGISGFKLCITQMKLDAEDGSTVKNGDSDLLEAKLGLVDLGDGSLPATWGNISIPAGTTIKRIKLEIHKNIELCGVDYSTSITDTSGTIHSVSKDIELKWAFATPKSFNAGDTVTVSLANLVTQYSAAVLAGKFDDENLGAYLESYAAGSEDTAE